MELYNWLAENITIKTIVEVLFTGLILWMAVTVIYKFCHLFDKIYEHWTKKK